MLVNPFFSRFLNMKTSLVKVLRIFQFLRFIPCVDHSQCPQLVKLSKLCRKTCKFIVLQVSCKNSDHDTLEQLSECDLQILEVTQTSKSTVKA